MRNNAGNKGAGGNERNNWRRNNIILDVYKRQVENDYTFVADDEEMKVEISYTFNASALGGKNLVTFEELYDFSNPDEPVKVAEPVSYTHLDVYKRQAIGLIMQRVHCQYNFSEVIADNRSAGLSKK